MKVKDLIEQLKIFDQELDVYVCDEIEGNDTFLSRIEIGNTGYNACDPNSKAKDVLMLRWN